MKHAKRLVALFMSLSLIANHTSTVIALGDEYKRLFIEQSLNAPNITWDTKDEVIVGTAFDSMKGVKAIDDEGNDITDKVKVTGSVDTSKEGEYTLTYSIADSEEEPITRVVRVIPNPEFNVSGSDYVRTYKGEEFDYKQGLTVTDSKGNDITSSVTCEGNVDVNKLGSYNLKYYVPDKKEPILERTVDVIEKNVFNVYLNNEKLQKSLENYNNWLKDPNKDPNKPVSIEKDLAFSIYLDNKTSKFALENQSSEKLDVSIGDEVFANIKVFDKDNNEKLSIELLGSDTGDSEKLDKLKALTYEYGDYISIVTRDSKNCLDITGTLTGDIDNTKEDCKEYYSDGVDNLDYIKNVRFNIVKEGIKTVYNNAPVITGLTEMEKLLTTRDEQLKGISITDDKDTYIPLDEVVITEEKDGNNIIGLRYTVCDDWGREASGVRYLKNPQINDGRVQIEQSIQTQQEESSSTPSTLDIQPKGRPSKLSDNFFEVLGVTYPDNDWIRFKIKFDIDNMEMYISESDNRLFDNKFTGEYFRLEQYSKDGVLKSSLVLNGNDRADSEKIRKWDRTKFAYGDQLKIYHKYTDTRMKIGYDVLAPNGSNNWEDYSRGIPTDIQNESRFEITRNCLKRLVNKPPEITWPDKNLTIERGKKPDLLADITVKDDIDGDINRARVKVSDLDTSTLGEKTVTYTVTDSWGATYTTERTVEVVSTEELSKTHIDIYDSTNTNKIFTIGFDDFSKRLSIKNTTSVEFDSKNKYDTAFRIRILSKKGVTKKDIELFGKDTGKSSKLQELNNYKYAVDDYIEIRTTTSKAIRINGEVTTQGNITDTDFSDGLDTKDLMDNTRFQLNAGQMKIVYNEAPSIEFNDAKFARTDKFNPAIFVKKITDDHDNDENGEGKLKPENVRAEYDEEEIYNLGKHSVKFILADTWGREYTTTTTIETVSRNKLEKVNIDLMKVDKSTDGTLTSKSTIATLYFDDVKKKIVPVLNKEASIDGQPGQKVFTILIYGSNNEEKYKLEIDTNTKINQDTFKELSKVSITKGDYIHIEAYSPDAVCISGQVVSTMNMNFTDYSNGFKDFDKMKNTMFEIQEEGLTALYNEAPHITWKNSRVYQGDSFDVLSDITITDDRDTKLTTSMVTVVGDTTGGTISLDTTEIGVKTITYKITDSWGRTALIQRSIFVRSNLEKAKIEIKDNKGQTAIILQPDSVNMKLSVEFNEANLPLNKTTRISNTTEVSLALYNEKNEHIGTLDILGSDDKYAIEKKLTSLTTAKILRGSKIHIDAKNTTQVSITGIVSATGGNITTGTVDFSKGNYDRKYLDNSVFKLIDDGIEVLYNQVPSMNLTTTAATTTSLTLYKGDDYRQNLLDAIEVIDELEDDLSSKKTVEIRVFERTKGQNTSVTTVSTMPTTSPVAISTSSSVPLEINTTGSYVAYYTVKDSWGEKCPEILVKDFNIVPSIDRNIINLGGPFGIDKRRLLTIGFDSNTMNFKIKKTTDPNINSFNNQVYGTFYKIDLCTSQGKTKLTTPIVVAGDYNFKKDSKGYFSQLGKIKFEYGDYIQMDSYQVQRMSIEGPVRNPVESDGDYATPDILPDGQIDTQGIYDADKFKNTRFYITEEGLDAKYISPVELTTGRVLVDYDGLKDGSAIKLLIDSSSGTISVPEINYTGFFNYPYGNIAFTVNFKHKSVQETFTFTGCDRGPKRELKEYLSATRFVEGDYIEFRGIESRKKSISLVGDLKVTGSNEDYSDGVDNLDNLNNVRFYFRDVGTTNAHIEAVYNKAPEFKGVEEVNFYIKPNSSANRDYYQFNTTSGVTVVDDNTTNTTFSVTGVLDRSNNIMHNGIPAWGKGEYKCIYNTTDSWGRVTEYTRKIYVRPDGYKNKIIVYPKTTSDTTISGNNVVITSDSTAAFKIAIDDRTDKYKLVDRKDVPINSQLGDNPAFAIAIYDANNHQERKRIILDGNDTGLSSKLDELSNTRYKENDYIRVWSADPRYLAISGDITKDKQDNSTDEIESFNDGIQEPVYMNNTAFKINDNRMTYIYNKGAKITTTRQTLYYKSNISDNLVDLVTITDDKSTTSEMTITYEGSIDTNKVGIYPVTYTVVDNWGRTVQQTINFEVAPNYSRNAIQVYSNDGTHMFDIGFNTYHNKLSVNQITTNKTLNNSNNKLKIVVRDNNAKITNTLEINETDFTSQGTIEKIKQIGYVNNGFISFESSSPNSVRIIGNITGNTAGNSFDNGFKDETEMQNSRFMLEPEGLKLITKETPVITFKDTSGKTVTSTSITRGDDSNLYDSIDLGFKQPENYIGVEYSNQGLDKDKSGKQDVTFIVNDSWGTSVSTVAVVDVKARNYLEERIIQIKDGTDQKKNLATLRFDTINKKIIINKSNVSYNGKEELLLTFKLYDKNGITKKVKRITKYNITSSETLEKLFEDVYFEDGDRISLESYDDENGIAIYGNIPGDVTIDQEDYSDGVQNPDYIDNVRFEIDKSDNSDNEGTIREYSLRSVYNHAPEMTFDKEFKAYKGIEPNFFDGVNVTDSDIHDKDINIEDNVQIDTEFDPDILGDQKVDYIATDTWGRQTSTEKTVTVESGLLSNRIEYYTSDSSTEPLFYVYLDKTNNKLKVNSDFKVTQSNSNKLNTEPFELTLYYSENSTNATTRATIKKELKITTDETLDSIRTKLNDFNNTAFKYGEYLGVYAKDHKNDIKIKGQINQPLRITEDYSEGITTADFMNNVKFKITEEELMAIYNEAPEMILPTDSTLVYYKGDKIFPGEGAIVRDDIDLRLTVEDVYISKEEEKKFDTMGTTMVSVTVTDYWGRSTQGERKIEVRNALTRNELIFGGYNNKGGEKRQKFKLVFDTTHKTIYITGKDAGKMNDQRSDADYYNIKLYDGETNKVKFNYDVPAECDPTKTSFGSLEVTNTSHGVSYEQGDYFKFNGPQVFRMSIDGAVRNELENYENGVNMSANFIDTRFYIEDSGLRAEFQNSMPITTDESLIEFNVGKGKPLRMKVDHNTGQVTFGKPTDYFDYNNSAIVFKLNWYTKDDSTMHTFSFDGWDSGNGSGSRALRTFAQNHQFKEGDYITFETPTKKFHKRIELSGKIIKPTTPDVLLKDEDFSDGIDYEENMLRTEFHYNKDGVHGFTIFKKAAAVISGAEDIAIPQNSTFDITSGVTAKDYDNADLTSAMTITVNGRQVRSGEVLNTDKVGPQEVVYRVTNRAGITSAVYRNINVYSVPGLTTIADVAPLEQGSVKKDSEELKEYLLSLVIATDTDDSDITSKVTVTSDIDPEKAGTYKATYSVTNSFGQTTTLSNVEVEVIRTISVDVPIKVPFQVVTNLLDKEADPFVAGTLNLRNNKTSDVKVSLDGFTQKNNSGSLQIVTPGTIDWDNLTTEASMKQMALGIYNKTGDWQDSSYSQEDSPLWLYTGITSGTTIGTLERAPSLTSPSTAKIGFTSKHGKKFRGGTSRGKFELRFKFE